MSLVTNLQDAFTRVATETKSLRTLINGNQPTNGALITTAKGNLVAAINEVAAAAQAASGINDTGTSTATAWSSSKTNTEISAAINALVAAAPGTLNTLDELAAALGDDPNLATTLTTAIAGKAPTVHTHAVADVTGLQTALDGKAAATHTHTTAQVTGLDTALAGKAATTHTHVGTDVAAATDIARGTVELATTAEATTGTDTTRAITPAGLKTVADTKANTSDIGSTATDFVATFTAGLV